MKAPVFIIGCHRSGTTLLRALLDAHPTICCPPESKVIGGFEAALNYPQVAQALQSLGSCRAQLARGFGDLFSSMMKRVCDADGKERWIDKTPNYYRLMPVIDEMFANHVQYVVLVRHPLDSVVSLSGLFGQQMHPDDPDVAAAIAEWGRTHVGWARYWTRVNEQILVAVRSRRDRTLLCRYEDLVAEPTSELSRILSFIGEPAVNDLSTTAFDRPCPRRAVRQVGAWVR